MVSARSVIALVAFSLLSVAVATQAARGETALGRFSLAAPKGWQLDAATRSEHLSLLDPAHTYFMRRTGQSASRCAVELRAESVPAPAAAQTLQAVRMRSGVIDAREDEVRRSQLVSGGGIRIWKSDYRTSFSAGRVVLPVHSTLYSFRGPDGRVYTLHCCPTPGSRDEFAQPLDELARSIRF